jgi:hypothetical protein
VNYRGVGASYAYDPDMVYKTLMELTRGLQMASDHQQDQLRAQAQPSAWNRFKAWIK